jgi:manganese/iron transport system substrate-binding protein
VRRALTALSLLPLLAVLVACGTGADAAPASRVTGDQLRVVTTTTVLADLVAKAGGESVEVRSLVPQGGEVHTFDPSPGDIGAVAEADVVFMNGLGLDEWARELVDGAGGDARIVELGEALEGVEYIEEPGEGEHGGANPHLWLNVDYAARYVDRIAEELGADASDYRAELDALHEEIGERMAAIPEANRRIVSFHEAFPYFAEAYGLDVVGVVVENPGQDPSAGEIAALVEAIRASGAKAVFSEAQFNPRLAETIAAEAGVPVESGLHNDSLGDPPADSYVGMMRANADRIEAALR